jgi:prepilin-type N-terminal cleavage/methylation domain-containing protein
LPYIAKAKKNYGFTIIELLIVIAIIAILAAIAIPQLGAYRTKTNNKVAVSDLRSAAVAQEAYFTDNRQYTNDINVLATMPYNLSISRGVTVTISSASNEAYLMNAYHSQGNITYAVSGPGGTVSP